MDTIGIQHQYPLQLKIYPSAKSVRIIRILPIANWLWKLSTVPTNIMPSSVVGLVPYQGNYRIMDKNEYSDPNLNNLFKVVSFSNSEL